MVKEIQADKGGEFINKEVEAYCAGKGIKIRSATARAHQSNRRAKRFQQTTVQKEEAMRHAAGLSSGFWKVAMEAAMYIYDQQPSSVQKWRTTFEVWKGRKPNVANLRAFGCLAWVHVHKDLRTKNNPRAKARIFVSYEPGVKAWQFWDADKHKVIVSHDAKFDELFFPHKGPLIEGAPLPEHPDPPQEDGDGDSDDNGQPKQECHEDRCKAHVKHNIGENIGENIRET
jgi:hypothetical protein